MVWCNSCDVMVLYKKRCFCKGDGEVWKSLEIYEKYVWVFCEESVCKIYGSVR